jgi:hypothetical protein
MTPTTGRILPLISGLSADGFFIEDTWAAPGIGSVKSHIVWASGDEFTETLKEFKPGKYRAGFSE